MSCVSFYMDRFSNLAKILVLQEMIVPSPPDVYIVLNGIVSYNGPEKGTLQIVHPGPICDVRETSEGWLDPQDRNTKAFKETHPDVRLDDIAPSARRVVVTLEGQTHVCNVKSFPIAAEEWWPGTSDILDHRPVCSRIPVGELEQSDEPYAFRIEFRLHRTLEHTRVGGRAYRVIAQGPIGTLHRMRTEEMESFRESCSQELRPEWERRYMEVLDDCERLAVKTNRFVLTVITPTTLMSFPERGHNFLTRGPRPIEAYASKAVFHTFTDPMEPTNRFLVSMFCLDLSSVEHPIIPERSLRKEMEEFREQRGTP